MPELPVDGGSAALDGGPSFDGGPSVDGGPSLDGGPSIDGGAGTSPRALRVEIKDAPAQMIAGRPFPLTIEIRDEHGNLATDYRGVLTPTSSDPQAGLQSIRFGEQDRGRVTYYELILKTAGVQSLSLADAASSEVHGASVAISVEPSSAHSLALALLDGDVGRWPAGETRRLHIALADEYGNLATSYRGAVLLGSSDPRALLPSPYQFTAEDAGQHIFEVALLGAGQRSVGAADRDNRFLGAWIGVDVIAGPAHHLALLDFPPSTIAGHGASGTVAALDVFGNGVSDYAGTIRVSSSDPFAEMSQPRAFEPPAFASGSVYATLRTAGTQQLTATDVETGTLRAEPKSIEVQPDAPNRIAIGLDADATPPLAGVPFAVRFQVTDAYGNITPSFVGRLTARIGSRLYPPSEFGSAERGERRISSVVVDRPGSTEVIAATPAGVVPSLNGSARITVRGCRDSSDCPMGACCDLASMVCAGPQTLHYAPLTPPWNSLKTFDPVGRAYYWLDPAGVQIWRSQLREGAPSERARHYAPGRDTPTSILTLAMDGQRHRMLVLERAAVGGMTGLLGRFLQLSPELRWGPAETLLTSETWGPTRRDITQLFRDDLGDRWIALGRAGTERTLAIWELRFDVGIQPTWRLLSPPNAPVGADYAHWVFDSHRQRLLAVGGRIYADGGSTDLLSIWALSLPHNTLGEWSVLGGAPSLPGAAYLAAYDSERQSLVVSHAAPPGSGSSCQLSVLPLTDPRPAWRALESSRCLMNSLESDPLANQVLTQDYPSGTLLAVSLESGVVTPLESTPAGQALPFSFALQGVLDSAGSRGLFVTANGPIIGLSLTPADVPIGSIVGTPLVSLPVLGSVIADERNRRMVLFGGVRTLVESNEVFTASFDHASEWAPLPTSGEAPTPRTGHSAIYDPVSQTMIVYGGSSGNGVRGDTWQLTLPSTGEARWSQLTTGPSTPSPRQQHAAIYDPKGRQMLITGGFSSTASLDDLWALSLDETNTWRPLTVEGPRPPAQVRSRGLYLPRAERFLLYNNEEEGTGYVGVGYGWFTAPRTFYFLDSDTVAFDVHAATLTSADSQRTPTLLLDPTRAVDEVLVARPDAGEALGRIEAPWCSP